MKSLRKGVALAAVSLMCFTTGCGYFLYPERVGQSGGRVDPAVLVLDAAGLLFGIIPGVIAFAVDLSTGAIYLPPGESNVIERHEDRLSRFQVPIKAIASEDLHFDPAGVAERLSLELGQPINPSDIHYYQVVNESAKPVFLAVSDRLE
ncbi:hypothetical protein ACXYTJ_16770 [Gilvimarinus sp. F26214L]|uniref:hypothetical protein n=1 Tax=Gilvimarinus sp. DZF01 TaxID=3461371 RepID=UPI004045A1AD